MLYLPESKKVINNQNNNDFKKSKINKWVINKKGPQKV